MNFALYKKEIKGSFKILLIFAGMLTMYIVMIVSMYDPELSDALKQFEELMPELMSAVGMTGANETLTDFMSSYLYGMILLVFPMVYTVIWANGLIAKYVDRGSMAQLLAAPVKRSKIAVTQLTALISGIAALIFYCTVLEYGAAQMMFPGELSLTVLLRLNAGLLCLHLFIAAPIWEASSKKSGVSHFLHCSIPTVLFPQSRKRCFLPVYCLFQALYYSRSPLPFSKRRICIYNGIYSGISAPDFCFNRRLSEKSAVG